MWSGYSITARSYLPEKLQIVKPLEGDYSSQRHKSSQPQNAVHNDNESFQKPQQKECQRNPNSVLTHTPQSYTQMSANQSQTVENKQKNQYLIFQNHRPPKICLSASQGPKILQRSSSLLELSSWQSSRLHLGAPLALVTGLMEVLEQQEGSLNLQHSFYFRYTQPRCWFEV